MNRRGFIASILALGAAPAIVRASSLMPVRPLIVMPTVEEIAAIAYPDFRAQARAKLAQWWAAQFDEMVLRGLRDQFAGNSIIIAERD